VFNDCHPELSVIVKHRNAGLKYEFGNAFKLPSFLDDTGLFKTEKAQN